MVGIDDILKLLEVVHIFNRTLLYLAATLYFRGFRLPGLIC